MNAILEEIPELSGYGVQVSPGLDRIIRAASKRSRAPVQSASDLAFALDALSITSGYRRPSLRAKKPRLVGSSPHSFALVVLAPAFGSSIVQRHLRADIPGLISACLHSYGSIRSGTHRGLCAAAAAMTLLSTRTDTFETQPLIWLRTFSAFPVDDLALSLGLSLTRCGLTGRLAKLPSAAAYS
jgi:hypothetical protein